jgi:formate dehydrogenase subunit gamma
MATKEKTIIRFDIFRRVEHLLLLLSFTLLALTGLPQKFPTAGISIFFLQLFGGIETIRIIHRIAATVFLLEAVYHMVFLGYQTFVLRGQLDMLPDVKDGSDALQAFLFNLGFRKEQPKMGRYNFAEKAEYWAMVWGMVIMALTGFMMWNPIATTRFLPGEIIPAAKVAHGGEAILAVLAIFLWHFYNVHIKHWNWSMIKGTMTRHEMEAEHALELENIENGIVQPMPEPAERKRRLRIYVPVATVVSVVLVGLIYMFVASEHSAITTVPPQENVAIFSPRTPTPFPTSTITPTSAPTETLQPGAVASQSTTAPNSGGSSLTWDNGVGALFEQKCKMCHGTAGGLALTGYAEAMQGVGSAPVILPGNPDGSLLVQLQLKGGHPGQFSADQLSQIVEWISAGAPEK